MSRGPLKYYPRYPRDFLDGTIGMSLEVKGAYSVLIDLMMMMGMRGLPDDAQYISGQLGCSVRKWNSIKKELIERGKIKAENGIISNKRADKEKIIQSKYQDKQAENRTGSNENKDLEKPPQTYINTDTDTDTNYGGGGSAGAREPEILPPESPPTFRERCLEAMGHDPSGITANGRHIGRQADMLVAQQWVSDLGLTEAEIIAVIRETVTGMNDPPTSFKYFTGPMQRTAGAKRATPLKPEIQTINGGDHGQRHHSRRSGSGGYGSATVDAFAAVAANIAAGKGPR